MKTAFARRLIVGVVVCFAGVAALAGPLTPPGAPAPSGKTLTEVEPRIALSAVNTPGDLDSVFSITAPGSYYLTGNVNGSAGLYGVKIQSSGVTLDLNGFSLIGGPGSLDGVFMSAFGRNIVIRNGHVRNWGGNGLRVLIDIGRIEGVIAADNGGWGIDNAPGGTFTSMIVACEAFNNGFNVVGTGGIRGGLASVITDCIAYGNTGVGIFGGADSRITGCLARSNSADGIAISAGGLVSGCTASSNVGDGIEVSSDCTIVANVCDGNGFGTGDGAGIHVTGSDNRIEGNNVTDNDRGIDVDLPGSFITRNTASGNTKNWDVVVGSVCLVVVGNNSGGVDGNSGGAAPGSTDPNANFTY